jgi:hypothetical protein
MVSASQVESELNFRGYFESLGNGITSTQVLAWSVDAALQSLGKPLNPAVDTYLSSTEWAEVIRLALEIGPQLIQQYGILNWSITESLVIQNLNARKYWKANDTSKPTATMVQILAWSVDGALTHYGKPLTQSAPKYLATSEWDGIISYALSADQRLETQYTIIGGAQVNGLSGISLGAEIGGVCYNASGLPVTCGTTQDAGWGSQWGPIILQILGSALTIAGNYWQASQIRNQANTLYQQSTAGASLGTGTTRDAQILAQKLMTQNPSLTYDKAYEIACGYLGLPVPSASQSSLPSWALPAGIALAAIVLLKR